MIRPHILRTLIFLATSASAAAGQTMVRGQVHRAGDTTGVSEVSVRLIAIVMGRPTSDGAGMTRLTDSTGAFLFAGIGSGRYQLSARRLGFEQYVDTIVVAANETTHQDVELVDVPEQLPTVLIRGEMVKVPKGFEDVYRRGAHSFGYFMTAEQIDQRNPMQTRDLLAGLPGVLMEGNSLVFQRCGRRASGAGNSGFAGSPQVYIDGQRVTRFARGGDEVEAALSYVEPRSIQAIEVYTGLAQIPGDFATQACAAIAIWTKRQ